jgi:hypothetical protein
MFLSELFATFLKEKAFLSNLSPKTNRSYQQAFNAYQGILSKSDLPTSEEINLLTGEAELFYCLPCA